MQDKKPSSKNPNKRKEYTRAQKKPKNEINHSYTTKFLKNEEPESARVQVTFMCLSMFQKKNELRIFGKRGEIRRITVDKCRIHPVW